MVIALASKPGITGASTLAIPKTWDAVWFRNFISNQLKGADVRNAVGTNGIKITGNISSPYATITLGAGPIVIPATPGQVTLTVNGAPGQNVLVINSNSSGGQSVSDVLITRNGSTANTLAEGPNLQLLDTSGAVFSTLLQNSGGQTELWQFNGSWIQILKVLSTRGVVINAPASGVALTSGAGAVNGTQSYLGSTVTISFGSLLATSTAEISSPNAFSIGTNAATALTLFSNALGRIVVGSAGNVTVNIPASGIAFNVNGLAGAVGALQISTTDATFSATGRSSLLLANSSTTGQTPLDFFINGSLSGRIRNDFAGNMNYVSTGGIHVFFTGGDSGVGTAKMTIANNGGIFMAGATGSSQGVGTINATGLFINSIAVPSVQKSVKAALTARASTVTLTNDPDLAIAIAAAGTYEVQMVVYVYNTGSATIGAQLGVNYSGTFTAASSVVSFLGGVSPLAGSGGITAAVNSALVAGNCGSAINTGSALLITGVLTATGAGTVALAWAQNSSNATATNVGAGSYMIVTKIG